MWVAKFCRGKTCLAPTVTVLLLLVLSPVFGQERGVIVEGNLRGESGLGSLNPLLCENGYCGRLAGILFPTLDELVEAWEFDGEILTYHLRDNITWSDGTPITAKDVYFSYLVITSREVNSAYQPFGREIIGAAPIDDYTLALVVRQPDCATHEALRYPVIPTHGFVPDFAPVFTGGDILAWSNAQPEYDFSGFRTHPFNISLNVSSGRFEFDERRLGEAIRLSTPDDTVAYEYVDVSGADDMVNRFLRGELNLLFDPPFDRRADIRADEDVSITELPGDEWFYIALNLSDPDDPQSAFDEDGNLLEQEAHPILSDIQVRRAMQMALDVPTMIDAALDGYGVPLGGSLPPDSWAFNPDLVPTSYDLNGARQLLEQAGWKDVNRDGVRECITCTMAEYRTPLSIDLYYPESFTRELRPSISYSTLATLIARDLGRVGIQVNLVPMVEADSMFNEVSRQRFDAYLSSRTDYLPNDQAILFTPVGDNIGGGIASYRNPQVTDLFEQARNVPSCDVDARREIYQQLQAVLHDEQPFIWLFSPTRMVATRDAATPLQPLILEMFE